MSLFSVAEWLPEEGKERYPMKIRKVMCLLCAAGMVALSSCGTTGTGTDGSSAPAADAGAEAVTADADQPAAAAGGAESAPLPETLEEPAEPELPEGQYLLDGEHLLYKIGEEIIPGSYHLEDASEDFKCIISDRNAAYTRGNVLEGYTTEKIDYRYTGYCMNAAEANNGLYNLFPEIEAQVYEKDKTFDYHEIDGSGTVSQSPPEVLEEDTRLLLTKADCYLLRAGGNARLVLDKKYDPAESAAAAKQPDYGVWNDNDYVNEGLGIKLHVPSGKKMGWRPSGDSKTRSLYVTAYNSSIGDVPPYVDVIDEVATELFTINSYTNSSLRVMVYDTGVPMGESMGDGYYQETPEHYVQELVDRNNRKAAADPEHYSEVTEIADDQVFGMDAKWVTFVTKEDQAFGWEQDADYNTTYTSHWICQKDNYLIDVKLTFSFAQMDANKDGAEQYNREKYDECMDVVGDLLKEL